MTRISSSRFRESRFEANHNGATGLNADLSKKETFETIKKIAGKKTEEPIEIVESELEGINLVRLRSILAILESKHMYPDHKELVESLVELVTDYPADADDINVLLGILTDNEKEKENCKYCTYQYLCAHRKAGEI